MAIGASLGALRSVSLGDSASKPVANPIYTRVVGDPRTDPNAAAQRAKLEAEVAANTRKEQDRINAEQSRIAEEQRRAAEERRTQEAHDLAMRSASNRTSAPSYYDGGSTSSSAASTRSSSGDDELRQIEIDTAREKLNQMRSPPSIDTNAIAALKTAAMPAAVPPPSYVADKTVSDNAFARAKDTAGLLALQRTAGARTSAMQHGTTGGGREIAGLDSILGDTVDNLTGVATAQAEQEAQRGYEVANRNYAGAITQRGQEIGLTPSLLSLIAAQRRY